MVKKLFRYQLQNREGLILQCGDHFGEIAPLSGFSKETLAEAEAELKLWIDENRTPTLPSVCFGTWCAQRPLHSVRLPLCALGPKKGYPAMKLKLGHLPVLEAVDLVKRQSGILRIDCNRKWTLDEAIDFTTHFKLTDFAYMEEPTEDLVEFSKRTGFPIAVDESIGKDWSKIPTLRAVVIKPTIVGRIPYIPKYLDLVLSSSYESGLGLLHIANLAQKDLPVGLDTVFENDLLTNPIQCSNGEFIWEKKEPILKFEKLCRVY